MTKWRKARVYLDTSVISYLEASDAPQKMMATLELWELLKKGCCEIILSEVVMRELRMCKGIKRDRFDSHLQEIRYEIAETNDATDTIADKFIELGILTKRSMADCQHIAIAMYTKCDILLSWNMRHISNVNTRNGVKQIGALSGYDGLEIMTPDDFLEGKYEEGISIFE